MAWLTAWLFLLAGFVRAHDPGLSTGTLRFEGARLSAEFIFARADIETIIPLDADRDGKVSTAEWELARPKLKALAHDALTVQLNGKSLEIAAPHFVLDENNNIHLTATFPMERAGPVAIRSTLIARLPRGHREFVSVLDEHGATLTEVLLSAQQDAISVDGPALPAADRRSKHPGLFREFFAMGVNHILTGYDHLLFLFGLLVVMSRFKSTLLIVTCFTLAHSCTLALAAFDVVRVSGRVVEPLIAATIMYVGVENLLRPEGPKNRWRLTLLFGLVHGLGFATDLKEKLHGVSGRDIVMPLISFNLGVELGQLTVAALVLPLIWWLRTKPIFVQRWVPACSLVVALAGGWWLVQRTVLSPTSMRPSVSASATVALSRRESAG